MKILNFIFATAIGYLTIYRFETWTGRKGTEPQENRPRFIDLRDIV